MADGAVDALDLASSESGLPWHAVPSWNTR
jgi:hypothetical protein